jgi:UDP-3-O-[3-hydroxymyristoyl] glucosamine N-acyltransferase
MKTNIFEIIDTFKINNDDILIKNNGIIDATASIDAATSNAITFCKDQSGIKEKIYKSKAGIIVCPDTLDKKEFLGIFDKSLIFVKNPRLTFIKILNKFLSTSTTNIIHESVIIEKSAKIGKNVSIGPFSYIGHNVLIGDDCKIASNISIYENTIIQKNVSVNSGAIIGSEGFGFEKNDDGEYVKFPHIGNVLIEDNVDIMANVVICRASLGTTKIGRGSKISNNVFISHNVKIGDNVLITADVNIHGSCYIGNNVYVAPSVNIDKGVSVGNNVFIGIGSIVTNDIPQNSKYLSTFRESVLKKETDEQLCANTMFLKQDLITKKCARKDENNIEIEKMVIKIAESVFTSSNNISIESSKENIIDWDSLRNLQFISTLEKEFCIEFPEDGYSKMNSINSIINILKTLV